MASAATPSLLPQLVPTQTISPPVRVSIRTRPALLDSYNLDTEVADTKLIQILSKRLLGPTDVRGGANAIQHLITRVARYVWIIIDYSVPENDCEPSVTAFDLNLW